MQAYMLNQDTITVYNNGEVHTASVDSIDVDTVEFLLEQGDYENAIDMMDVTMAIAKSSNGLITIEDEVVYVNGVELHNSLTRRILQLHRNGKSFDRIGNFLVKLENNPSFNSRGQLYRFLDANNLPIAEDGSFLAYKYVNDNYMDNFTKTIRNHIGDAPEMDRSKVDDDPNRTCSSGLHVCSEEYIKSHFGRSKVMIVSVDPADVVAVPHDYQNSKMRTCKYTVVSEHDGGSSRIETSDYDAYETAAVYTEEDMESASLTAYQKGVSDYDAYGSW
jgi:hypothetical protein